MKSTIITFIIIAGLSFIYAVEAIRITSESQLLTGDYAAGMIGDYLLKNDSVSFIISDIPHAISSGNTGGQLIDAALADGVDKFELFYLYLNNDWPRQGNYDNIQLLSSGDLSDSAHIRVEGTDSDNGDIAIVTNYILYDSTATLKVVTRFLNNCTSMISNYGIGDAFAWGATPFFPGETDSADWLGSRTIHPTYGYYSSSRFAAVHGHYWSDATLKEVTLSPGDYVDLTRYFLIGNSLQDIYSAYMQFSGVSPGTVTGNVSVNGSPQADVLVVFIKEFGNGATFETKTDGNGNFTASIEPGDWTCRASYMGRFQDKAVLVNQSTETVVNFIYDESSLPDISGDTLSIIQTPLINIPLITFPGDTFHVEIVLPQSEFVNSLALSINGHETELNFSELAIPSQSGIRTIETYLPENFLYGLYDLKMVFSATDSLDISAHSVYVIPDYKDEYTFIHVTDTHLPSHYFWGDDGVETDSTEILDFREVIKDINIINPEFVLHTGDLVNDNELEALGIPSISRAKKQLYEFDVPIFLVAGNHDLGGWDPTPAPPGTARQTWWKFFGWKHLDDTTGTVPITQDYSFKYGKDLYIGLEVYELYGNYDDWRIDFYGSTSFTDDQLLWLNNTLQNSPDSGLNILFYHYDMNGQIDLSTLNADAAFFGHNHSEYGDLNSYPYYFRPGSTCDGNRRYRIVKVANNAIVSTLVVRAGNSGENLTTTFNTDSTVVRITNTHDIDLDNCLVTFKLEDGEKIISLTNATLYQIDSLSHPRIVYAHVNVPANSVVEAAIHTDSTETSIKRNLPDSFFLMNIYPNPFNQRLSIIYQLSSFGSVEITVNDLLGKRVDVLQQNDQNPGKYKLHWDASRFSSGIYFIKANIGNASGNSQYVEKCLLMK